MVHIIQTKEKITKKHVHLIAKECHLKEAHFIAMKLTANESELYKVFNKTSDYTDYLLKLGKAGKTIPEHRIVYLKII